MPKPRSKQFYDRLEGKIKDILKRNYSDIQFERAGSRARENYRRESDLDIRFYFPTRRVTKEEIYPKIIELLKSQLPSLDGEPIMYSFGTDRNIVKIRPSNGGKIDLVLHRK